MSDVQNCPNCGAVVHDCVCDYCGTVFPSSLKKFYGKTCMLVTIDENNQIAIMGVNVRSIEEKMPECHFYTTDTSMYYEYDLNDELTITCTTGDVQSIGREVRKLKRVCNERLSDF